MKRNVFAFAVAGLGLIATPVLAGEDRPTRDISIEGIDLSTAAGQKMLDERITAAARQVCRVNEVRTGTRIRSSEARACVKKAEASAREQVATMIADRQRGG